MEATTLFYQETVRKLLAYLRRRRDHQATVTEYRLAREAKHDPIGPKERGVLMAIRHGSSVISADTVNVEGQYQTMYSLKREVGQ